MLCVRALTNPLGSCWGAWGLEGQEEEEEEEVEKTAPQLGWLSGTLSQFSQDLTWHV